MISYRVFTDSSKTKTYIQTLFIGAMYCPSLEQDNIYRTRRGLFMVIYLNHVIISFLLIFFLYVLKKRLIGHYKRLKH